MKSIKELNEEKKIMLDKSEMLSSMKGRNEKSRANMNEKNHQKLVNMYMVEILGDFPEGTSLMNLAVNALNLMSKGYEHPGKHPVTEAFEKLCDMK